MTTVFCCFLEFYFSKKKKEHIQNLFRVFLKMPKAAGELREVCKRTVPFVG
ncbi:hypothetical protein ACRRTK_012823 [Alexandromys fortis]